MNTSKEVLNFCRNIYKLRTKCNLSQKEMACILNIDPKTLQLLEAGILTDEITVETLILIRQYFKINPSQLFSAWNS